MARISRHLGALVAVLIATAFATAPGVSIAPGNAASGPPGSIDAYVQQLAASDPTGAIPVLIQRAPGADNLDAITRHGATVRQQIEFHNLVAADVPSSALQSLSSEPGIVRISYDAPVYNMTTTFPVSSSNLKSVYPKAVRAAELWSATSPVEGSGVTVAVLDSGLKGVSDFMGTNNTGTAPGTNRLIAKIISIAGQASADDDNGHGTWVGGIVGGRGWGASGTADDANYVGIAPNVNLIGVKVSDATGQSYVSNVISGLQWVVNNQSAYNIRVVNLSLVSSYAESYKTSELDAAVEMAWLHGIVVVAASGNSGPNTELYAPANDPYVITVGAVDDHGSTSPSAATLLSFSSYGTTQDGYAKPELVAPGRHIVSTLYSTTAPLATQFPTRLVDNGAYIRLSGTSASAPIVTGVIADILQVHPGLTPDQVKWLLLHTAAPIAGVGTGAGYPQAAPAVYYSGTVGSANAGVIPNNKIAAAGCATLANCNSSTDWSTVSWNTVSWNTVSWNTVSWNTVSWNSTWEVAPTD